ncbi:MAG TPA: MBL fold metallo-hydrolase [Microlunatus sp.]|nr:MBL fold metallo-hydrolase [Microlunatus sp.]
MSQRPLLFSAAAEHTFVVSVDFAAEDGPAQVTVGLVVGAESALLIDTGSTPAQGRMLRQAAAAVTPVPLTTVVLTHWHYDHTFGLAGSGATTSIAHESVRDRLTGAATAAEAERLGLDRDALALPNRQVAVVAAIDLGGGVRAEAVHLGRGHTDGDLVVVVPGSDVVFAGDLVESAGPPQYGPDSFPHEWPATLDGLIGLTTERTIVLAGHGGPMDREAVFEQRGRIAAVSGEISRLAGLGVGADDAATRGDWALPFDAIRAGYEAGRAQARGSRSSRELPLV